MDSLVIFRSMECSGSRGVAPREAWGHLRAAVGGTNEPSVASGRVKPPTVTNHPSSPRVGSVNPTVRVVTGLALGMSGVPGALDPQSYWFEIISLIDN